jgi:hypothetical protein
MTGLILDLEAVAAMINIENIKMLIFAQNGKVIAAITICICKTNVAAINYLCNFLRLILNCS